VLFLFRPLLLLAGAFLVLVSRVFFVGGASRYSIKVTFRFLCHDSGGGLDETFNEGVKLDA